MVTVNPRLYKPIGFVLFTIAVVNLMFLIYPFADSVVVFRRCFGYWLFVILATVLFGIVPIASYTIYGIYWVRRQKLKQQANQLQGPSAPCAPDVIAKKVGIGIYVALLVLLSFISILFTILVASYHGASSSIRTPGQFNIIFRGNVTINRDDELVPHITAESLPDVLFAQGIAHSQDRLYQLDYYKRMALGRLATMQDRTEAIHSDIFFRTLNLNRSAHETFASLDVQYQTALTAYSDGVNHYVRSLRPNQRPFEYQVELEPRFDGESVDGGTFWTPQISLAVLKMFQFVMSGNLESELLRFYLATNIKLNVTRVMELVPMARYDAPTTWNEEDLYIPPPLVPDRIRAEVEKFAQDKLNAEELQRFFGVTVEEPTAASTGGSGGGGAGTASPKKPASLANLLKMWEPTHHWLKHGPSFAENTFGTVNWAAYGGGELFTETTMASSFGYPFLHQAPAILYLNHLRQLNALGEEMPVGAEGTGLSIPGVPGLLTGRTQLYSWSAAPMQSDVMDLYVLKDSAGSDGQSYEYQGAAMDYEVRTEEIKVRNGKTRRVTIRDSVHGPVISDSWETFTDVNERPNSVDGMRLALRWTGFDNAKDTTVAFLMDAWRQPGYSAFETVAYKFAVPAMNMFYGDRNGDPAGGYVAVGLIPNRRAGHTGLLPVNGNDNTFTWNGYKDVANINPDLYASLVINTGNRVVPPGFDFDIGYDFEESWRFEILRRRIKQEYTDPSSDSIRPLTASFAKSTMNSKESGLLFGLTPALEQTKRHIEQGLVTLTSSRVVRKINKLLNWSGEMSVGSGTGATFLGWYEQLSKLGQWESGVEKFHRPQFIVSTLAPIQNNTLDLSKYGYVSGPTAEQLARNDERCRRALVRFHGISEDAANNAQYPCSEYVAASLAASGSKSVGTKVTFRNFMMSDTTYKCVCDRISKESGGGAVSLNGVFPHFQQISYYSASLYQNDEHKFRVPLGLDANHWNKKKYDKFLREMATGDKSFWVSMYTSGSGYPITESLKMASA